MQMLSLCITQYTHVEVEHSIENPQFLVISLSCSMFYCRLQGLLLDPVVQESQRWREYYRHLIIQHDRARIVPPTTRSAFAGSHPWICSHECSTFVCFHTCQYSPRHSESFENAVAHVSIHIRIYLCQSRVSSCFWLGGQCMPGKWNSASGARSFLWTLPSQTCLLWISLFNCADAEDRRRSNKLL